MRLCRILAFFCPRKKCSLVIFMQRYMMERFAYRCFFASGRDNRYFLLFFLWNKILFLQIKAEKGQIQAKCRKNQG